MSKAVGLLHQYSLHVCSPCVEFWKQPDSSILSDVCRQIPGLNPWQAVETIKLEYTGEGIFGGAVKCIEIRKNTNSESTLLGRHWHWEMKVRGTNGTSGCLLQCYGLVDHESTITIPTTSLFPPSTKLPLFFFSPLLATLLILFSTPPPSLASSVALPLPPHAPYLHCL